MSDPNTLGSLVRKRRLESGYSLGQLASKVGKTAAEVRAWERNNELPEHGILERLAETLELDLDEIKAHLEAEGAKAAAEEASEPADEATPETVAPATKGTLAAAKAALEDIPDDADRDQSSAESVPEDLLAETPDVEEEAEEDLPGFAVDDPFTPPADDTPADEAFDLLNAPTEAVPVPVITETARTARSGRAAAVIREPAPLPVVEPPPDADPGLLRYLEPLRVLFDPHSRYLYWIRAALTTVVLLVFAVILFSQLGNLLDAIGELLDTIEPAATTPDELDALGPLSR